MTKIEYPLFWEKDDFSIKIFCSIPNIATGILLNANGQRAIIDPGDGILRDLSSELKSSQILNISDIFITHGHHDHVGGVWSLLTYLRVMRREKPLNIYYPSGCIEIESIFFAFDKVYGSDLTYSVKLRMISNDEQIISGNLKVSPFKVIHREYDVANNRAVEVPSLGYKFFYDDKSICYGGDTAYCENLVNMAKDSDLAIIEAGAEDHEDSDMHMTIEQASKIGDTAKSYFLVHVPE